MRRDRSTVFSWFTSGFSDGYGRGAATVAALSERCLNDSPGAVSATLKGAGAGYTQTAQALAAFPERVDATSGSVAELLAEILEQVIQHAGQQHEVCV